VALRIYEGAGGSRFVCDSRAAFGDAVARISVRAEAPIESCARERRAEPLLRRIGKMSQRQLYECAQAKIRTGVCPPGCHGNCNPANPPGRSTHERRNDGIAYGWWPPGLLLPVWGRGIDVRRDRVAAFCAEARREGFTVTVTYPGSPSESQHVNFRKRPRISYWVVRPLRRGMRGGRRRVTGLLRVLMSARGHRYLSFKHPRERFDGAVEAAVKAFQRDHHQTADGVVGVHTIRAMEAAYRAQRKRRR
jgi:peptidoglycan hydrolase-like protein with peptidoglycan-binding domain